jgi:enterochelin esterase-like enzyme
VTATASTTSAAPAASVTAASNSSVSDAAFEPARELTWAYDSTGVGPMQVVVSLPERRSGQRFPVLIAMHGRGEAFKGPVRGARGWIDDYGLPAALARLHAPPLTQTDFAKLADDERLGRFNATLAQRPYRGLIVVCPYTPDILAGDRPFSAAEPLTRFLVDELLPRIYRETPAIGSAQSTGVDGVSLGGRASILVGLARPEAFGAVGALQAAFDSADAPELTRRALAARRKNPKLEIRLLTSSGDYFLRANQNISKALAEAGVEHELVVIPGPHDYVFNRGPGVYEMLLFHDRALRGEKMFE